MDHQLIRSLMDETIESAQILGIDHDFVKQLAEVRKQVAPDQIGQHGQLQEWLTDIDKPNNNHRHMSPLWGLFPGNQITPADAKLFDAAKVLLKWRGEGSTGWSFAWRIPLWARVGDGDFAYHEFSEQIKRRTLPNLFDLCGPFQIDGNFGAPAGIAEMLLQSHIKNQIDLLPSLPKAWPNGSVSGLRARGGFEIDLNWENGAMTRVVVRSKLGNPCRVCYNGQTIELKTKSGEQYAFDGRLERAN
jgi:alpha-L-fucosidase 2